MKLLITGGTGLIGQALIKHLKNHYQITVLSRSPSKAYEQLGHDVHVLKSLDEVAEIGDFGVVINLQGEPIADKRWSRRQKQSIEQSRWWVTRQLAERISASEQPPEVFISGSAIGYYGDQGEHPVDEGTKIDSATIAKDFAHHLCVEWENLALLAEQPRTRVCIVRTGVVLAAKGGALEKMIVPYKFGLGGPLGDGKQMMSWIHLDDMVAMLEHLTANADCHGIYNATAPEPVSNEVFSKTLAQVLNKPHFMRVPAWVMKAALGEMSQMLLTGQAVVPTRIQAAGFRFRYPTVKAALRRCVG